jgi:gamma-glutamylcyclotransferase (GGCT)/AIG2-like uncharacterized protein YtfP
MAKKNQDAIMLFVYGTLKRGYGNNARCLKGAEFVGEAVTATAGYGMQNIGYPTLFDDQEGTRAKGEIFKISPEQLAMCDRLENHPRMYKREERNFFVIGDRDETIVKAWVYLWQLGPRGEDVEPDANNLLIWDHPYRRA